MGKQEETIQEVLERLQKDLLTASIFFEDRKFAAQVSKLDSAADCVDDVWEDLYSLQEAV